MGRILDKNERMTRIVTNVHSLKVLGNAKGFSILYVSYDRFQSIFNFKLPFSLNWCALCL